jgi:hypothetical protein
MIARGVSALRVIEKSRDDLRLSPEHAEERTYLLCLSR